MKIALCLLTLNEIDGCKHDIPLIKRLSKYFNEIFVVDNGSTDGTLEYLKTQKVKVYSFPGISYDKMHAMAIQKTISDAVIFFPPKGTNSVKDILKFKKYFESGYELIVSSRIMGENEEDKQLFKPRKWLTLILAQAAALRWRREGNIIWDCLHVFRGITVKSYKASSVTKNGEMFDIDLIVNSYIKKMSRIEFPTNERPRISGATHFKTIPFGIKIFKYFFKKALRFKS